LGIRPTVGKVPEQLMAKKAIEEADQAIGICG
jgi:hypothetical protein